MKLKYFFSLCCIIMVLLFSGCKKEEKGATMPSGVRAVADPSRPPASSKATAKRFNERKTWQNDPNRTKGLPPPSGPSGSPGGN